MGSAQRAELQWLPDQVAMLVLLVGHLDVPSIGDAAEKEAAMRARHI